MQYQELLQQTEQMNQQEFFNYLHDLQRIAKNKFDYDLFWEYWKTYMQDDIDKLILKKDVPHRFDAFKGKVKMAEDFDEPLTDDAAKTPRKAGFLKGNFYMSDDFDELIEDFKDYM